MLTSPKHHVHVTDENGRTLLRDALAAYIAGRDSRIAALLRRPVLTERQRLALEQAITAKAHAQVMLQEFAS